MILAYLILAHLLGDFVFQPTKLVLWKMKSKMGVFVHVLIHFIILTLILLPMLINGAYWLIGVILFISTFHFIIDQAKISYDLRHDEKVKPFIIDQLLHLLTILLAFFFIDPTSIHLPKGGFCKYYSDIRVVYFIAFIIFATSVIEIYRFQRKREKDRNAKFKLHPREMIRRMIVFTLIYILFVFLAVYEFGDWPKFL